MTDASFVKAARETGKDKFSEPEQAFLANLTSSTNVQIDHIQGHCLMRSSNLSNNDEGVPRSAECDDL